jgi:glutathione S-transferase
MIARLITIPISHYCERARLGLRVAGVAYREEGHIPVLHGLHTRRHGQRQVPLLVTATGVVRNSEAILRYADHLRPECLFPREYEPEVARICTLADHEIGVPVRTIAYGFVFATPGLFRDLASAHCPRSEQVLMRFAHPLLQRMIARGFGVNPSGIARAEQRLGAAVGELESLLADGRKFLVGNRLTAADVSVAALLGPLAIARFGADLAARSTGLAARRAAYSAAPIGQLVARTYSAIDALPPVAQ